MNQTLVAVWCDQFQKIDIAQWAHYYFRKENDKLFVMLWSSHEQENRMTKKSRCCNFILHGSLTYY